MGLKHWHGGHTKTRILYHLVWLPKYRRRILRGKLAIRLKELLYEACKMERWWIEEIKILSDHIHVLIQVQPKQSVSKVVQHLKGGTSKVLRKEFPEVEEFLWGDSFWADGYFAETVGRMDLTHVKTYIQKNQESMPQQI